MSSFPGNALVPLALLSWPVYCILFFFLLPPRRAVLAVALLGYLFLPSGSLSISGFPDYGKENAIALALIFGILIRDPKKFLALKPSPFDIPVLVLCLVPAISSLTNGLGTYDAMSAAISATLKWLVIYAAGRAYLATPKGLREFGIALFLGGILYIPFCLWEVRMSPQLRLQVYGLPINFVQNIRWGGYRPCVFIGHGLPLSLFMMDAAVMGFWLWRSRSVKQLFGIPVWALSSALMATEVLCKGSLAISLMLAGIASFPFFRWIQSLKPLCLVALLPVIYILVRATGMWDAQEMIDWSESIFGPERAASLSTRVYNDTALSERALQRPFFGWDGWGRNRIFDESGRDTSITDSLWCITLGCNGIVGLVALLGFVLLPATVLAWRAPPWVIAHPVTGAATALLVLMVFWMIDLTLNATINPLRILAAGGLSGLLATGWRPSWRTPR